MFILFRKLLDRESKRISKNQCHGDDVIDVFPRTTAYVSSIMERAELLLNVTIKGANTTTMGRSFSNIDKPSTEKGMSEVVKWWSPVLVLLVLQSFYIMMTNETFGQAGLEGH